jgi:hypothetical protein
VLNLFVAVDAPLLIERLLLDGAAGFSMALTVTLLMKRRQERSLSSALTT